MPEYLSPGVYMEEFDSGPRPIEGVSTSTAAFLGKAERGPVEPRLITSFPEFQRVFGGWIQDSYLAYSVDAFFKNGGQRCYVARIVSQFDWEKRWLGAIISTLDGKFIEARAIGPGQWINRLKLIIQLGSNHFPGKDKFIKIRVQYWESDQSKTQNPDTPDIEEVFDDLDYDPTSEHYYQNAVNGISNFINLYPIDIPIPADAKTAEAKARAIDDWVQTKYPGSTKPSSNEKAETPYIKIPYDNAEKKWRLTLPDGDHDVVTIETLRPLDGDQSVWVAVTDTSKGQEKQFNLDVLKYDKKVLDTDIYNATPTKTFSNLKTTGAETDADHYVTKVTEIVKMIKVAAGRPKNTKGTLDVPIELVDKGGFQIKFSKADDPKDPDTDIIQPNDYTGIGKQKDILDNNEHLIQTIYTGLEGLGKIDDISIVSAPDGTDTISKEIIDHCEKLKDRFAIYQPDLASSTPNSIGTLRTIGDYKYAAIYTPWVTVLDPLTNLPKHVPPSGFIAGIYARSDSNTGVHKAPANELIQGITGTPTPIDKGIQDVLNPRNVNCIRTFPGRGTLVWGARTNSANPNWKYINVRRLFIFISKSIERATQWVVFMPNNEKLWSDVKATIAQFLTGVWRTGALMGLTPEEAYFVRCDRSTMTEDDIQNGRLVCVIGLATTKPAEFVIFRLTQTKAGATLEEL